jgi:hypothetical protein
MFEDVSHWMSMMDVQGRGSGRCVAPAFLVPAPNVARSEGRGRDPLARVRRHRAQGGRSGRAGEPASMPQEAAHVLACMTGACAAAHSPPAPSPCFGVLTRTLRGIGRGRVNGSLLASAAADSKRVEPPDGPASGFRDAVTDGAGVWGPILGGVVAVGGGIALVGTLLKDGSVGFNPNLECPSGVGADSCAPISSLRTVSHMTA